MQNEQPLPTASAQEWFFYFRLTKHLPAMSVKYAEADKTFSGDAETQLKIRTAFVSAGVDIVWNFYKGLAAQETADMLLSYCQVSPATFNGIATSSIAELIAADQVLLQQRLKTLGFSINDQGIVTGHLNPSATAASRPKPPKPF
jgi:hypothetical protein